jgi:copper homeostasis protein
VTPILEVIACSVADAIEAERGGASRLEIIRDFERGGLTPPMDLVRDIVATVSIPARAMLRESDGYTAAGDDEVEKLCKSAKELCTLGIDGLVIGFVRDGGIDVDLTQRVLSSAPDLKVTFHHAFEKTTDQLASIERLKGIVQVDRILASGGSGQWPRKIVRLSRYERAARPQINILAGGGLNAQAIKAVRQATGIREFHVGRSARTSGRLDGAVSAALVKELVQAVEACPAELQSERP